MDARAKLRLKIAQQVMSLLHQPDMRSILAIDPDAKENPIVVALPDDTVGHVTDKVDAAGGRARVIVLVQTPKGQVLQMVSVVRNKSQAGSPAADGPISRESQ